MGRSVEERFWSKVERREDGCWIWRGALGNHGYGSFSVGGKNERVHVWSYERFVAPTPTGLVLDHLCHNTACVNPRHMEPVTQRENVMRSDGLTATLSRKTHCDHGHPLAGDNLIIRPDGHRRCRECVRRWCREYRARRKER
jgi:hypothetical protein